jgi:crotonobetainyl-CoA:carnitine CoA-transferase CaiB-like acyl-CoA transferase
MRRNSRDAGLLGGALLAVTACSPVHVPAPTLSDMLEDRVLLDGIILKCNSDLDMSRNDPQCATARIALARIAADTEAAERAARQADFERRREQLRQAEERQRRAEEAANKVDPYTLPVVPLDAAPPGTSAPGADHSR